MGKGKQNLYWCTGYLLTRIHSALLYVELIYWLNKLSSSLMLLWSSACGNSLAPGPWSRAKHLLSLNESKQSQLKRMSQKLHLLAFDTRWSQPQTHSSDIAQNRWVCLPSTPTLQMSRFCTWAPKKIARFPNQFQFIFINSWRCESSEQEKCASQASWSLQDRWTGREGDTRLAVHGKPVLQKISFFSLRNQCSDVQQS